VTVLVEVVDAVPAGIRAVGVPVLTGPAGPTLPVGLPPIGRAIEPGRLWDDGFDFARREFTAAVAQALVVTGGPGGPGGPGGRADVDMVLLGLGSGDEDDAAASAEPWRRAAAALVRAVSGGGSVAMVVPTAAATPAVGAAVAEGAILASYSFDEFRSKKRVTVERLVVVAPGAASSDVDVARRQLTRGVDRGSRTAAAVTWARDLINFPPSDLPPRRLADRAVARLSGLPGTTVEVWDEERIASERLGALLGVSRGSHEPARLIRAGYEPPAAADPGGPGAGPHHPPPHVVLVGKGITFDSGGLSLKTSTGMTTMKTDMSGAAIVLGVVSACAGLGVGARVTALAPVAENMPGGSALKPGDVVTARNGSTIEVLDTDAEGRLVLADALSLAAEIDPPPDAIVDVATLTGAATIALGTGIGALFGSDDALVERVRKAGERAGERLWPMPMPEDYGEHIDSDVADMKNIGRPLQAGAIVAAILLSRFTGGLPWAHLDIAGAGRAAESSGYVTKGGTAFGLRTLLELLADYGDPGVGPPSE
jgi:leucyl aminopeptidase